MNKFNNASKKVNKSTKLKSKNCLWFVVAIIIIFFVFFIGHKEKGKRQLNTYNIKLAKASVALQNNLKRIQKLDDAQVAKKNLSKINSADLKKIPDSHYLERLAMPSTVYEAPPSSKLLKKIAVGGRINNGKTVLESDGLIDVAYGNQVVNAQKIEHANFTIPSGEMLHAVLSVAINSDLPGMLSAIISQPVYALTGERKLIPSGSRLIGQYSSAVLQGQNRIFIIWNRIILPNGITATIDSSGTDAIGRSGSSANSINRHFLQRFGQATLLSILGATVANYDVSSSDQYNSASEYRSAIADSLQDSANASLESDSMLKPTLKAYQGAQINVFLAQDLSFYDVLGGE
jgi:type IV secretion system protein VirB10